MNLLNRPGLDLYLNVCSISCTIHNVIQNQLNLSLKPHALNFQHWNVLRLIHSGEVNTAGKVAERMHVSPPIMTRLIDHLVMHKYLERELDFSDRRIYQLVVTENGIRVLNKGFKAFADLPNLLENKLTEQESKVTSFTDSQFCVQAS